MLAWCGVVAVVLMTTIVNTVFGIHQVGISPRTIFPWPTNALVAWFHNIGAALSISVLICWDFGLHRRMGLQVYAILCEALLTTVSIISRATFPFHVLPQMMAIYNQDSIRDRFTRIQTFVYAIIFLSFFVIAIGSVSILRDLHYVESKSTPITVPWTASSAATTLPNSPIISSSELVVEPVKSVSSFRWILIHQLMVNRWIGIEGLMSISSYEEKSMSVLLNMLLEKREIGKVTSYQIVSKSGYQTPDPKFQFASMPGIVGFLYYSGSLWVVFLAMILLVVLMVASERAVFILTLNPVFCSIYGMMLANYIAQFGVTPRQDLPQFAMVYLMAIILWLLCFRNRNSQSILRD
jgi:hypothetical protein